MTNIKLSKRMQSVADMVASFGDVNTVADIGCDHAFVSIYLKLNSIADKVIAMDVKEGPLDIARSNIADYGLSDYIDVRGSDGFSALENGEADAAVIAGMGGLLIVDILKRGYVHTKNGIRLVLQPQSDIPKVREYLGNIGYVIEDEDFLIDEGKYYSVIKAAKASDMNENECITLSDIETLYGPAILKKKPEDFLCYLTDKRRKLADLQGQLRSNESDKSKERVESLEEELKLIDKAFSYLEGI